MNFKQGAKQLKQEIPTVFLVLKDHDTPILAKVFAGITVGYALSPIDLIPDFIPVLGYLDDFILLPVLAAVTIKLIPEKIWEWNQVLSAGLWQDGKPQKWYYALPVIVIWLLLLWLMIKGVWF